MSTFQKSRRLVNIRGQLKHQGTIKNMYSHTHTFLCHILHLTVCTSVSLSQIRQENQSAVIPIGLMLGQSTTSFQWKVFLLSKIIFWISRGCLAINYEFGWSDWQAMGLQTGSVHKNLNRIPCQSSNLLLRGTIIPVYIIRTNSSGA